MTTQPTVKKNPDYTKSAKDLSSPVTTLSAYNEWHKAAAEYEDSLQKIKESVPADLIHAKDAAELKLDAARELLIASVKRDGGFQDTVAGCYALIQTAKRPKYDAGKFMFYHPNETPEIIIQTVDETKIKDFIKSGKLDEKELIEHEVITYQLTDKMVIQ
jgi:hypothetical protein